MGRRFLAGGGTRGGGGIPSARESRTRVALAGAAIALLAAVVVYASAATERLPEVVAGVGAAGCLVAGLALVLRQPGLVPLGLAGVGASYAVYLGLRSGGADSRSPFVAAAVFVAAELAFWSLAPGAGPALRRLGLLAASAAATVFVGSLLLALAAGSAGGVGLEAAGVAAAVATLLVLAVLARPRAGA